MLYIAVELVPTDDKDRPEGNTVSYPTACANVKQLVFGLARLNFGQDEVKLYRCEPLSLEEEDALWADLEARQLVCKHYLPLPGHPDYDRDDACAICSTEEARLQYADYVYDRSKDR